TRNRRIETASCRSELARDLFKDQKIASKLAPTVGRVQRLSEHYCITWTVLFRAGSVWNQNTTPWLRR
ncbi:hypothetical protein, partial [Pseudomonas helleri]|uniref:hypothetical protein n=1 Tax=Pseudomonas helleri TaxID=1608996 RepID=UPI003F9877B1